MNLLSLLLSAYLSSQSLGSLSNNTGVQQSQLKKLLILALPLLIKYMTIPSHSQVCPPSSELSDSTRADLLFQIRLNLLTLRMATRSSDTSWAMMKVMF